MHRLNKNHNTSFTEDQTFYFKNILRQSLNKYNEKMSFVQSTPVCIPRKYIIPNNNKKFYVFYTNKGDAQNKNSYKILYFFSKGNEYADFFMEIDNKKSLSNFDSLLLEGYLYGRPELNHTFMVSDILMCNEKTLDEGYFFRHSLISKTFKNNEELKDLNGHMSIKLQPVLEYNTEKNLLEIFKKSFPFEKELCSLETIDEDNPIAKTNSVSFQKDKSQEMKLIQKTSFFDVYKVLDKNTHDNQGILYVRTVKDSKFLKEITKDDTQIEIMCEWNNTFKKWTVVNL